MSQAIKGNPKVDQEVRKILAEMRKMTSSQKYLRNCDRHLAKDIWLTAQRLATQAGDIVVSRISQQIGGKKGAESKAKPAKPAKKPVAKKQTKKPSTYARAMKAVATPKPQVQTPPPAPVEAADPSHNSVEATA